MAMTLTEGFVEARERVSALEAGQRYGLSVNRSGFTRCPFHDEKTASMKLYDGNKGYFCFGCHAGGDVTSLVQALFHLSTPADALRMLDEDFKLGLQLDRPMTAAEREAARKAQEERDMRRQVAEGLERWRWQTVNRLAGLIQTANTMTHEPSTPGEIALIRWASYLEYLADALVSDDVDLFMDLYQHRGEIDDRCSMLERKQQGE